MKYPMIFNLKKSFDDNYAEIVWIKRVDKLLRDTFKGGKLKNFGTHFNVNFTGYEGLTEDEIRSKLKEVYIF